MRVHTVLGVSRTPRRSFALFEEYVREEGYRRVRGRAVEAEGDGEWLGGVSR